MKPIRIDVSSERGTYPVIIGSGTLTGLGDLLDRHGIGRQRLVVSSAPVWRLHGRRLRGVSARGDTPALMAVGERAKSLATVELLYEACVTRSLDRSGRSAAGSR